MSSLLERYENSKELPDSERVKALKALIASPGSDTDASKAVEQSVNDLCTLYVKMGDGASLRQLLVDLRPLFNSMPKAKTAKLVRTVIESAAKIPNTTQMQLEMCKEQVEWARNEKRSFLRQRIELRLASLYLETREFQPALTLIASLLSEVKRLDDKILLVEIYLLESRVQHLLRNLPRAKASLTAARSNANSVYVPPMMQAEIDLQSGTLHAEDKDYKTAYSYYFEAFEQLHNMDDPRASSALKYMLLCKVMASQAGEVAGLIQSKAGTKYMGPEVESMKAVAHAYLERSLHLFQKALEDFKGVLVDDKLVSVHLHVLYGDLMEQNLLRLVEPYSRVEVAHLAKLIDLPVPQVEQKLSQMILDKSLKGTIDQGSGCLEVFDEEDADTVLPNSLSIFENLGKVVDTLYRRSQKIVA